MDFFGAAHELYGVLPGDFMDTRKRLVTAAREAGDAALAKEIGGLRRPTVSAWAVNLLSRSAGDELGRLLDVGTELREAWSSGGNIGGLEQRRGEMIALLVRAARRLAEEAGQPLREPAAREVEDTLQAATVDPEVAEEVRVGTLAQPRSHAGFVPTGLAPTAFAPAPARPAPRRAAKPKAPAEDDLRKKAEEARAAADRAAESVSEWAAEQGQARELIDGVTAEVDALQRKLDEAHDRQNAARRRLRIAEREHTRATRTAEEARRRAAEAEKKAGP